MSDLSIFKNPIAKDGVKYYIFPSGYKLFKANYSNEPTPFISGIPSFFGIKNTSSEYIELYEEEYGIIFEFVTTKDYKLLALDDKDTQRFLYSTAPDNIKRILKNNYGYETGLRDSDGDKDRELANYLCANGYEGYATSKMPTPSGGFFHFELLICSAFEGVQFVQKVTREERCDYLIQKGMLSKHVKSMREKRSRKRPSPPSSPSSPPSSSGTNLFGSDSPPSSPFAKKKLFGGKRRKTKRHRKSRHKKTKRRQRR